MRLILETWRYIMHYFTHHIYSRSYDNVRAITLYVAHLWRLQPTDEAVMTRSAIPLSRCCPIIMILEADLLG